MNSIRIIYQGIHSKPSSGGLATDYADRTVFRLTWPPIHSNSIVLISASECNKEDKPGFTPIFDRLLGDAAITVQNISPQEGFVDFRIYVDWEQPINVAVDIVVIDPPELMIVVDRDMQDQEVFQVDVRPSTQHISRSRRLGQSTKISTRGRNAGQSKGKRQR